LFGRAPGTKWKLRRKTQSAIGKSPLLDVTRPSTLWSERDLDRGARLLRIDDDRSVGENIDQLVSDLLLRFQ
jgi:hypothetical protein